MGQALFSYDIPVMQDLIGPDLPYKGPGGSQMLKLRPVSAADAASDVCPGRVVPADVNDRPPEHHDLAAFEKLNGMECCGVRLLYLYLPGPQTPYPGI